MKRNNGIILLIVVSVKKKIALKLLLIKTFD